MHGDNAHLRPILPGRPEECSLTRPRGLPSSGKAPSDLVASTMETSLPKGAVSELVFIPFARTKLERRKATKTAISHSMRAFRRKERDLQLRGPTQKTPKSANTVHEPPSLVCISNHLRAPIGLVDLLTKRKNLVPRLIPYRPFRAEPPWSSGELESVHSYLDQCYSFGIMKSLVRPMAVHEPVLYYALTWHCQCELNAITFRNLSSPTSLFLRSNLLGSVSKMLSDPGSSNSWATVLAVSLLSTDTAIVTHGSDMEHPLHANALLALLARGQEDIQSASDETLSLFRPAVLQFCWNLEMALLGPAVNVDTMPILRDLIYRLELDRAGACEDATFPFQNPLSCVGMSYSAPSFLDCSEETLLILADIRDFLDAALQILTSSGNDADLRYTVLASRVMGYQRLPAGRNIRDPIYEACRLCAQLTVQMAILKLPRYWTITSTRYDIVDRLNKDISAELGRIDPVHLWNQHNGLLYWVVLVGTCMSRSTAQYPLFKTLLFRLSSTHIFSEYDDIGFALSLKNFVAFQTFCASAENRIRGQIADYR